jgi:hypothetical protein
MASSLAASPAKSPGPPPAKGREAAAEEDDSLEDLDAMSEDFNASVTIGEEPAERSRGKKGPFGKAGPEGDFDPQDLAAAIRDRLKRD